MGQVGGPDRGQVRRHLSGAGIILLVLLAAGCTTTPYVRVPVTCMIAGSLVDPFAGFEEEYEANHPGIDLRFEGHGSIQAIRQVTDLHRQVDLVAVADASLIPDLMNGSTREYTTFGTTEMVVAFTNRSRFADEINESNWASVLARPDVRVGIANPMLDAAGYRAILVLLLMEKQSGEQIFGPVLGDHLSPPLVPTSGPSGLEVRLPEVVRPDAGGKVAIRDGSVFLLSLLEAGGIDYVFEYRSVAEGRGLHYVTLPETVNLGSRTHADVYRYATVFLGFQRFTAIGTERVGLPIEYAVTIPDAAVHKTEARELTEALIRAIAEERIGWPKPHEPNAVTLWG